MKDKSSGPKFTTLLAGIAVGAGAAALIADRVRRNPDRTPGQLRVNFSLDRALRTARRKNQLTLDASQRYVIFSDHHKGARNLADDFQPCEKTYLKALDYYYDAGYSLIILGDAEELWEEEIQNVLNAYENVLQSEARFIPDRYFRIYGNHDDPWQDENLVAQYLNVYLPSIQVKQGIIFEYREGDRAIGDILLVHGHQGTLDSETLPFLGQSFLPLYREFQNLTGLGRTSPSEDACLRAEHDSRLYRWSSRRDKMILIAGHTHRPVWSSATHLEKLVRELYVLQAQKDQFPPEEFEKRIADLRRMIKVRQEKYPPCTDTIKTRPSYFNTGCCRFEDGDITGIEFANGEIRLIKWEKDEMSQSAKILEKSPLTEIFAYL